MSTFGSLSVYILMTILSTFFLWLSHYFQKHYVIGNVISSKIINVVLYLLAALPFIIISGYRVNVGTDFLSYVKMAEDPVNYPEIPNFFRSILIFLDNIGMTAQGFFLISTIVIIFCYFIAAYFISDKPYLTIFMFIIMEDFFASMNIIRQFIATGIILIAYLFYKKRKLFFAFTFNIIAFLIHPVVIIFDLVLFLNFLLRNFKLTKIRICYLIFLFPVFVGAFPVVKKVLSLTPFGKYLTNSYSLYHYRWTLLLIITYFIPFILITFYNNYKVNDKSTKIFLMANYCILVSLAGSYFISANTYRIMYTITPLMSLYYPQALQNISRKDTYALTKLLIEICFIISTGIMITHDNNNVIPYYNLLFSAFL